MAAFAPASVLVRRRFGARAAVLLALALIALGTGARSLGGVWLLFAATTIAGIGIGLAQTVVPGALRGRFADREVMAIAALAASISGGAIAAAGLSAPLAQAFGSWRPALAVWAAPTVLAGALWVVASPRTARSMRAGESKPSGGGRYGVMGLMVGVVSFAYFVVFAWLAPLLVAAGLRPALAGLVLATMSALQIPAALGIGMLAPPQGGVAAAFPRWLTVTALGLIGLALIHSPWAVVFALPIGLGLGVLFALSLMLPVRSARDADEAVWLSGRAFGIGYLIASSGPLITGLGRDWTGSLSPGFLTTAALLLLATSLARRLSTTPRIGVMTQT